MLVARNIEAVMARKGLERADVNRLAGLGHTGVNDILSGKSKNPGIGTIRKIAERALNVPVVSLLVEPSDDPLDQEIFEVLGMLPKAERRRFLRIALAMGDDTPSSPHGEEAPLASPPEA